MRANIVAGLEGLQLEDELEKAVLSKTLLKNALWKCGGPCGQNLRWDHFFDDDIKKHGRHNSKHESGAQEHSASVAAATRLQRTQSRREEPLLVASATFG